MRGAAALLLAAACSGGKAKTVEDARRPSAPSDASHGSGGSQGAQGSGSIPATPLGPYRVDTTTKTGDVQIRVEWKNVPQALRAPGAPTPCGSPARPALAPTTTWGIPDAFVSIEVDHGKALVPARARVVLEDCTLSPRAAVASEALAIASAVEHPASVTVAEVGRLPFGGAVTAGTARTLYLPIVGHEVEVAIAAGGIYAVGTVAAGADAAAVVVATTPYVAVTEVTGNVVLRDVPVGTHAVRAWLPKRGPLEAKTIAGSVTVTEGALAEVTLDIGVP